MKKVKGMTMSEEKQRAARLAIEQILNQGIIPGSLKPDEPDDPMEDVLQFSKRMPEPTVRRYPEPDEPDTEEEDETPTACREVSFTIRDGMLPHSLVDIHDGYRSFTMDLSILPDDDTLEDYDLIQTLCNTHDDIETLFWMVLAQYMPCMYPSAFMRMGYYEEFVEKHIIPKDNVFVYEYTDIGSDIVTLYLISDETHDQIEKLIRILSDNGKIYAFMKALADCLCVTSYAFIRAMNDKLLYELVDKDIANTDSFEAEFDERSAVYTSSDAQEDDVVIYSCNISFPPVDVLMNGIDEEDEDTEEEDDDDEMGYIPSFPKVEEPVVVPTRIEVEVGSTSTKTDQEAVREECTQSIELTVKQSSTPLDQTSEEDDELIPGHDVPGDDHAKYEMTEDEYYRSRGKKPPEPQHAKKKVAAATESDDPWVIKKR